MRYINLVIAFILFSTVALAAPTNTDPVLIEDFENGLDPATWIMDLPNGKGHKELVTTNPHSPDYCLFQRGSDLSDPSPDGSSQIKSIPLFSLEKARIDFWFRNIYYTPAPEPAGDGNSWINLYNDADVFVAHVREKPDMGDGSVGIKFVNSSETAFSGVNLDGVSEWRKLSIIYRTGDVTSVELLLNDISFFSHSIAENTGPLGSVCFGVGGQYDYTGEWYIDDISVTPILDTLPADVHVNCFTALDLKYCGAQYDKIFSKGCLELSEEAAPFDPHMDDVVVTINGEEIMIPAGSFIEKHWWWFHWFTFAGDIPGVGFVQMCLNPDWGKWALNIRGMDATPLLDAEGAEVSIAIGNSVGMDDFIWTKTWHGWHADFAYYHD